MTEILLNRQFDADILREQPTDQRVIRGVGYACLDTSLEADNPFVQNQYDFEEGFYRGEFEFASPLTGQATVGTPETYGRHRVVAALLDRTAGAGKSAVLDLGCGTVDVARTIPPEHFGKLKLVNADISGPWASGDGLSALERGTDKLLEEGAVDTDSLFNLQYNFNQSQWTFGAEAFDHIVSNMVFHHMRPELKLPLLRAMHASLKSGGSVIFTDVFNKDEAGARMTQAGLRGPDECGGHIVPVSDFIDRACLAGFEIDDNARALSEQGRNHQTEEELGLGMDGLHVTTAINKAIWFMELKK